ncbi:MAG: TolC family protein [Vulcanimicrobiaceae bacterium]
MLPTLLLAACLPATAVDQPADLTSVLQRIASQSPTIQAAQAGQRAADAQEHEARAAWFGKVDTYARSMHYNDPRLVRPITEPPNVALYPFSRNQFGYGVEAQLPIDISGQILASVQAARANARRAMWNADDQRLQTILDGAALYRNLQALTGQRNALEAQQHALANSVAVARKGLKVGSIARVDLLRVQAAEAAVQSQLAGIEGQEQHLRAQLAALMDLPTFQAEIGPPASQPVKLPRGHLRASPMLAAAQSATEAAAASERSARRAQLPQLALTGGWDHNAIQFDRRAVDTWQVMLVLKLNLWSGGAQRAQIAAARAAHEEAADKTRQTELGLIAARVSAVTAWHAQSKAYLAANAGLEAARESARIERDRFKVGLGSATDLIDAEAALAQAQAAVANALAAWWEADDALRYAYGEPPAALQAADSTSSSPQP